MHQISNSYRGEATLVFSASFHLLARPVRRVDNGILLEPMATDIDAWFVELDRFADVRLADGTPKAGARLGCGRA